VVGRFPWTQQAEMVGYGCGVCCVRDYYTVVVVVDLARGVAMQSSNVDGAVI
jgi:hypothetical protein